MARLQLVDGMPLLRPAEQVFDAMFDGWRNQRIARDFAATTVAGRRATVRVCAAAASGSPGSGCRR
jgi:integrase/recombinase XerC